MKVLCVNAGSSSLKFQVYEMPEERVLINGYIEKIGEADCYWTIKINGEKIKKEKPLKDHTEAAEVVIKELLEHHVVDSLEEIKGIGHRVLHGGEKYKDSCLITDEVINDIKELTKLGPLHHPGNLAGIEGMAKEFPNVPMVAVFDTAFHATMPKQNYLYPVPYEWYQQYGVRKYGFHGTSHKYITETMKVRLKNPNPNLIICHIGSGSSISCIKEGKCYDTTMGITPLDGLMMGTRCGSIDPSIIEYVCKESGMSVEEVTTALNKQSGFFGICGKADCRDVEELMEQGDETAKLAYEMYTDRVAKYIAEYFIKLDGHVDAIVFTAGVGENGPLFREIVLTKLKALGITIDYDSNNKIARYLSETEGKISADNSSAQVFVVPTNEEIMIVRDVYRFIK